MAMTMFDRFASRLVFVANIPLRKIANRVWLQAKRRLVIALRAGAHAPVLARHSMDIAEAAPGPVFPPRKSLQILGQSYELEFLGRRRRFRHPIDWHPAEFSGRDLLWKMNLHYHEYLETADDETFLAIAGDWVAHNSRARSLYWLDSWNAYSLSIRVVVWMQQIVRRQLQANAVVRSRLLPSLVAQLRFLEGNLETDIGGNHLIKNIKALIWAGAFFEGHEAHRYAARGISLLRRELAQILSDGMHYERSASYHAQVFADLLETRHAHGHDPLDGALDETLDHMALALTKMTHPDGQAALFNDAGLHMAYAPADCLAVFERLRGKSPPRVPEGSFALETAGYFGFASEKAHLLIDCGAIAPDDLPAHGHGDVLAIELSWGGLRFVVDQGVFEYNAGGHRDASRSAGKHNTLCFEDSDQAQFFGSFRVGKRPRPEALVWRSDDAGCYFEGSVSGFVNIPPSVAHVRRVGIAPDTVTISDTIRGTPGRTARIGFLLHPEVRVQRIDGGFLLAREEVTLAIASDRELDLEPAVWWPDMGIEMGTTRIVAHLKPGDGGAQFTFTSKQPE
jgi:hypothetical protein